MEPRRMGSLCVEWMTADCCNECAMRRGNGGRMKRSDGLNEVMSWSWRWIERNEDLKKMMS